jgi:hypothetical protein
VCAGPCAGPFWGSLLLVWVSVCVGGGSLGEPPTLAPPPTGPTGLCGYACWVQVLKPQRCAAFPGGACVFRKTKRGQVACCCKGSLKRWAIPFKPSLALCLVVVWRPGAQAPGRGVQPAVTSVWGHQALVPVTPGAVWWFWFLLVTPANNQVCGCASVVTGVWCLSPPQVMLLLGGGVFWAPAGCRCGQNTPPARGAWGVHTPGTPDGQTMVKSCVGTTGRTAVTAMQALLGHPGAGSCGAARCHLPPALGPPGDGSDPHVSAFAVVYSLRHFQGLSLLCTTLLAVACCV